MIDKGELMTGNYVNHIYSQSEFSVVTYFDDDYIGFNEATFDDVSFDDVEPIVLDEKWHKKFGVEKNGFLSYEYIISVVNNFDIKVVFSGDYIFLRQGDGNPKDDDVISIWNKDLTGRDMYVHEWQNMYQVLTGKKLTI